MQFNLNFVISLDRETRSILSRLFVSVTVMRIIIEIIYRTQISVIYGYSGFKNDFDITNFIISLFLMYSLLPFTVNYVKDPCFSKTVLFILYLINYVPGTILMTYMDLNYVAPWYVYYAALFFFGSNMRIKKRAESKHHYMNITSIYILAGLLSAVVLFIWIYYAHGRVQLGLDDVYSIRMEARGFAMPMILRYIFASMKIVLPIFVVWSINNKFYGAALVFSCIQLLAFFTDGTKSTLFGLVAAILAFFFLKNHESRIRSFPWIISFIGLLGILEYRKWNSFQISGIIIRRVMFVPQALNRLYYEFFSNHSPDLFMGSLLKIFGIKSKYGSIAMTIGRYFNGSEGLAANNGLFSDAIANLWLVGVIIMPFVLVVLLKIMDNYSTGIEIYNLIGSIIPFSIALMSASFFTLFLSHGVVAMILIFYFLPRNVVYSGQIDHNSRDNGLSLATK